ncbi:MAG: hybrid sensor histidine kinase/response regulator [Cyanobacteria bacterium SBLK]|nr:hybrid sensor histidine kinase/response regulator [Cyanobacteria bacterium SBLK]
MTQDLSNFSMLELFRMEVETQTTTLNNNLLALESKLEGAIAAKHLEALMRAAHSIKGAARIVGLDPAVSIAHTMEDYFVFAQKGEIVLDSHAVDVLLHGVDWFIQLSQCQEQEIPQWLEQQSTTRDTLANAIAALSSPSSPLVPSEAEAPSHPSSPSPPVPIEAEAPSSPVPMEAKAPTQRIIRVNADNLEQLMALAGESLVEANWLHPFIDTLQHLKRQQQGLSDRLDKLQQEGELSASAQQHLAEAQKIARDCQTLFSDRLDGLEQFSRRFGQLSENLYREVIASHMRPFADGVQGFPRMVRDLAKQLGKRVKLEIMGQGTQVDRDILDKLEAPLTQMLRNAIVHGIESPENRRAAGKPETGIIRLEATHRAGMLSITVRDDGCGIDLEALRRSVMEKQLATPDLAARLSEAELMEFLFLPGFSTADRVTEIAGRGVGLDIAKNMTQEVGGVLRAVSFPGKGLAFHFQLPLTLSVIRALLVEIAGEPYAFGLARIDRVVVLRSEDIHSSENRPYAVIDEENISLVRAQQVLELPETQDSADRFPTIVLGDRGHRYGIIVDRFLGERNLVVRPLDPRLGKVQDISAAAITEAGLPLLIVDVADLVRSIDRLISEGHLHLLDHPARGEEQNQQKHILVVDDSIAVREMERKLLQNHGYRVDVAVDGMEGWNAVRTGNYDLIISDIDMPRMNGIELIRLIKEHPQLKSLPAIVVSYKDRQEDRIAGLNAGANYYLTKSSFHDNSLLEAVADSIA